MSTSVFLLLTSFLAVGRSQIFNCTRYQQPCDIDSRAMCCGYPFFDCLSDGVDTTCQSLRDFPELTAEFLLRMREAMDSGSANTTLAEMRRDVNSLLGNQGQSRRSATTSTTTRRTSSTAATRRPNLTTRQATTNRPLVSRGPSASLSNRTTARSPTVRSTEISRDDSR